MRRTKRNLALLAVVAVGTTGAGAAVAATSDPGQDQSRAIKQAIDARKPKNVILLVGDGTGDSELTLGSYYLNGAKGAPLAYETLPFTGSVTTWNLTVRSRPGLRAELRARLGAHRDRVVDRQEDDRRPAVPGAEHGRDGARAPTRASRPRSRS